ncbi:uncharacterized protein ARMOST_16535 [Armillaria ostoyae]|uniref:Uncharacterized protein n=1 Tax=Armillaria ostoyae TaxID=47428 RepID=A0A284RWG5_ARMOS|nr:uncharacterized protein ARMOST_16535 [Armillaria ostoyae]
MAAAKAEHGFFFGRLIAIVAQLGHSTDPSCPGRILLLRPVFKLQNENLPYPNPLTQFQANRRESSYSVFGGDVTQTRVRKMTEAMKENTGGESDIPSSTFDLQVAINAMISQHRWLRSHRDTLLDGEHIAAASNENSSRP